MAGAEGSPVVAVFQVVPLVLRANTADESPPIDPASHMTLL